MPDGTTFYLEEVRTGRKDLAALSMWKYPAAIKSNDQIMARLNLNVRNDGGDAIRIVDVPKNATALAAISSYGQDERGSIVFPIAGIGSGQTVINLFESADPSTFLHESSHFFLEAFTALASDQNAPQQMKDDKDRREAAWTSAIPPGSAGFSPSAFRISSSWRSSRS